MKYLLEKELRFALNNLPPCDEDRPPVYDIPLYKPVPIKDFDLDNPPPLTMPMPPMVRFRRRRYVEAAADTKHWVWVLEEIPEREK